MLQHYSTYMYVHHNPKELKPNTNTWENVQGEVPEMWWWWRWWRDGQLPGRWGRVKDSHTAVERNCCMYTSESVVTSLFSPGIPFNVTLQVRLPFFTMFLRICTGVTGAVPMHLVEWYVYGDGNVLLKMMVWLTLQCTGCMLPEMLVWRHALLHITKWAQHHIDTGGSFVSVLASTPSSLLVKS